MSSAAIAKKERIACSYQKLRSDFRSRAQSELEALVRVGVLVKLGNWYRVQRPNDFPTRLWFGARIIRLDGLMLINFDVDTGDYPA